MRKILIASLSIAATLAAAGSATAATVTSTFTVSATVLKNCLVSSANIGFGNYTPAAGALAGSSAVTVRCTKTTPYTIALNAGTTTGGTIAQRLLANGANRLQYNLYTTAGFTSIWGDGTGGSITQAGTGNGVSVAAAQTLTVFGSLPDSATNQDAPPGAYSDTITVTVTY